MDIDGVIVAIVVCGSKLKGDEQDMRLGLVQQGSGSGQIYSLRLFLTEYAGSWQDLYDTHRENQLRPTLP